MAAAFPPAPPLAKTSSDQIRIARVLCILFMITVHFGPGDHRILAADAPLPFHIFYLAVIDYLGRSSVPLLSVISGVLIVQSFRPGRQGALIQSKIRSLVVPLVIWSALALALIALRSVLKHDPTMLPQTGLDWLNAFFSLTTMPANYPLAFLRDIFVSSMIGVALLSVWQRQARVALVLMIAIGAAEVISGGILVRRTQILIFYMVGMLLALNGRTDIRPGWLLILALIVAEIFVKRVLAIDDTGPWAAMAVGYLSRLAMSLLIWRIAIAIREGNGALARIAYQIEPHIFFVFCSHLLLLMLVSPALTALRIGVESPAFIFVFLTQFVVAVGGGVALSSLGWRYAPRITAVLSGKRVQLRSPAPLSSPS